MDFLELINAEQRVDLQKVRDLARHGVPDEIRGEVWMYLLGVLSPDKTSELTTARSRLQNYIKLPKSNDLVSRLVTPIANRYHLRTFGAQSIQGLVREATTVSADPVPILPSAASSAEASTSEMVGGEEVGGASERAQGEEEEIDPLGQGWSREEAGDLPGSVMTPIEGRAFSQLAMSPPASHIPLQTAETAAITSSSTSVPPPAFLSPASPHEPPPIHLFTRSVVDVLSAWVNRLDATSSSASASFSSLPQSAIPCSSNPLHPDNHSDEKERKRVVESWVETVAPFVVCLRLEAGVYWGWGRWREMMDEYNDANPLPARLARFMFLFRTTLPDLYNYFEDEEVPILEVASSWLESLFSKEMNISDLSRLWDAYFSQPAPFDLHLFVCLSVLSTLNGILEELDQSEARGLLLQLPRLDIDRILHDAHNLRLALARETKAD